jgi:hypothetical protein
MSKSKRTKLDIPSDWPRPWLELGEGSWSIFRFTILRWKKYQRTRVKFSIYGVARGHYTRIWYGKKVLHFKFKIKRIKPEGA